MQKFLLIAIAGACGATLRYSSYMLANRFLTSTFPWTTISVNTFGCFIFGFIFSLSEHRMFFSGDTRIILLVGFVGAFTTFSAFAFESIEFIRHSQWAFFAGNLLIENVAVLIGLALGMAAGKVF